MKNMKRKLLWLLVASCLKFSYQAVSRNFSCPIEKNSQLSTQSPTKLIVSKVESKFDEKFLNLTIGLSLGADEEYSMNFDADLLVGLEEFLVQIGIALPTANGKYEALIKNSVSDICKYYKNRGGNVLLHLFFNSRFGTKSFPESCPVEAGRYFMKGFQLDERFLKIRALETKFLILVDLCTKVNGKLKCFVNLKFYGEAKNRLKWEKEMAQSNRTTE